ncbi:MAG: cytochrome c biogenesis protein CcsA [Verrucomicrobiales bacterium]|nr:cytochrome c biogenesis protein CcsA [Verrucomicrobiales bacterium]
MSTKRQIREEQKKENEVAETASHGLLVSYVVVGILVVIGLIIAANSAMFLLRNARSAKDVSVTFESYQHWPEKSVDTFRHVLVHQGGRALPVQNFARFALLGLNNKASVKFETADGEKHKIGEVEWLMDALFRGDMAKEMPMFNVDDTVILQELGVPPKDGTSRHRKRDTYSYNHLIVARAKLSGEGARIAKKQQDYEDSDKDPQYEPSREELLTLRLSRNLSFFEYMVGQFGFARKGENLVNADMLPPFMQQMAQNFEAGELLERMPEMPFEQMVRFIQQPAATDEDRAVQAAFQLFFYFANSARHFAIFPPENDPENGEWFAVGDALFAALDDKELRPWAKTLAGRITEIHESQKAMWPALKEAEKNPDAANDALKALDEKLQALVDYQRELTAKRYEYQEEKIEKAIETAKANIESADTENLRDAEQQELERQEINLKRLEREGGMADREVKLFLDAPFKKSLVYFIFAFLLLALSWLAPGTKASKILGWIAFAVTVYALYLNVYGIIQRSIIRSRPPITNLYDTIIFITGCVVFLGLFLEGFTRKGVGLILAVFAGVGGMFLSIRYEAKEATDTMEKLQAVLDTNFWLATHVTAINFGYAAGLAAALLGAGYLLARFFHPLPRVIRALKGDEKVSPSNFLEPSSKNTRDVFKLVAKMTYGIVLFCLFLSIVGTILGGIWANYSWGRFWGWDPKENGALMICLWSLVILHAKMGGYIRDIGLAVNSIILGMIVTFSWWGVNNLGVGLHSYGFTDGVWGALYISWAEAILIMACGFPLWLQNRVKKKLKKQARRRKKLDEADDLPPPIPEGA